MGLTGFVLVNGGLIDRTTDASAEFTNCGQGLREGGDVKMRGVQVGEIETIEREVGGNCKVVMGLFPNQLDQIPANVGAQIRAKTFFGEKEVELLFPAEPVEERLAEGDVIPADRTLDPLEVETILNTALPLLEAVDPENLSAALTALSQGFVGHEEAAIRGIESGIEALRPLNRHEALVALGIEQLSETGEVFGNIDEELLAAMDNLDALNRFTVENAGLIEANFDKVPGLLRELSFLFESRFGDIVKLVDRGATVIGVLASRTDDLDRLLTVLPKFNSNWIRNLNHECRYRQQTDEDGKSTGDRVPGRCWRVHNLISHSQGPYTKEDKPRPPERATTADFREAGLQEDSDVGRLLYAPALPGADER